MPLWKTTLYGFQHVLAMFAGAMAVPLLVAGGLALSMEETATLIQWNLLMCGVATIIQSYGIGRFVGIRMPVMMGVTFTALPPLLLFGKTLGLPAVFGGIMVSGLVVWLIAPWFARVARWFSPLLIGSVILTIGLSLLPLAIRWSAGAENNTDISLWGSLLLAGVVVVTIIGIYLLKIRSLSGFSVLVGFGMGIGLAALLGWFSLTGLNDLPVISFPPLMPFGWPSFDVAVIFNLILVNLITMVESLGVFYTVSAATGIPVGRKAITRGYRAEGLAIFLGGIFGSFPYTTFSQNAGLITLSGIKSRYVLVASGIILILLGLFIQGAWFLAAIPMPVIGGAALVMFATIAVAGIRILRGTAIRRGWNLLVPVLAAASGLFVALFPGLFDLLPFQLDLFLGNSIAAGVLVAILVYLLLRMPYLFQKKDMYTTRFASLLDAFVRSTDEKSNTIQVLQQTVMPSLNQPNTFADLGCGTGEISAAMATSFSNAILVELDKNNIRALKKRFHQKINMAKGNEPTTKTGSIPLVSNEPLRAGFSIASDESDPKTVTIHRANLDTFKPDFKADLILFSFSLGYTGLALQEQHRLPFRMQLVEQYMTCLNPGGKLVIVDTPSSGPYRNLFDFVGVPVHDEMTQLLEALEKKYPVQKEPADVNVRTKTVEEMVLCLRLITYDDGTKFLNMIPWYLEFAHALPRENGLLHFHYTATVSVIAKD